MAKVYKMEIYVVDYNDEFDNAEQLTDDMEELLQNELWVQADLTNVKESDEFEWHDDLQINKTDSTIEDLEVYLKDK